MSLHGASAKRGVRVSAASYRLSKDRQFSFSVLVEVFDVSCQSKPDFDPQLTGKFGFCATALWVLYKHSQSVSKTLFQKDRVCVCMCIYLEEDSLQLSAVFPAVLLGEDHSVCWDAVVCYPAVTLQHPYDNVWKTVLRLGERHRGHINTTASLKYNTLIK